MNKFELHKDLDIYSLFCNGNLISETRHKSKLESVLYYENYMTSFDNYYLELCFEFEM